MPRTFTSDTTFDDCEDRIFFTVACVNEEELTRAQRASVEPWEGWVEAARAVDRRVRKEARCVVAARSGADRALDRAVSNFARDLKAAVRDDYTSGRYLSFFRVAPSVFNDQPLAEQASTVKGWLGNPDEVLVRHKAALASAVARVEAAIAREAALANQRGEVWTAREKLAEKLNAAFWQLEKELTEIAQAQQLDRSWVGSFFEKVASTRKKKAAVSATPSEDGTGG